MPMTSDHLIRQVNVEEVLDLRWRLLRAGLPRASANFEGDDEPTARHIVALQDDQVVGCVTMLRRAWENKPAWQIRGMAVEPELQKSGVGRRLIDEVERIARSEPHSLVLWCNARTPARGFYEKMGWSVVGDEFVIPTAGPHFKMTKVLKPQ